MRDKAKGFRFEYAALGVVILSVGLLYGMVLSGSPDPAPVKQAVVEPASPAPQAVTAPTSPTHGPISGPTPQPMAKPELLAPPPPAKPAPPEGFGPRIAGDQAANAAIGAQGVGEAQSAADSDITVSSLVSVFRRTDYQLGSVLSGEMSVPRILVDAMPADIAGVKSPADRKRVFIQLMLPLALRVNEQILVERERLTRMNEQLGGFFGTLDPDEAEWLDGVRRRYGLETTDIGALLRRVDVVPPSLALAQAAEESGWGTSRFAREGNALFGQRTFAQGKGLVPLNRGEGQSFEVMIYDRLLDSVAAYMANLNSHRAYKEFRLAREYQRKTWGLLDGYDLAGTLERYSERGEAYVGTIRSIIAKNGLRTLDSAQLGDGATIVAIDTDI